MRAKFSGGWLLSILLVSGIANSSTTTTQQNKQSMPDRQRQTPVRNGERNEGKETEERFSILVKKRERKLYLFGSGQRLLKTYRIALGSQPTGTKKKQGDGATPEGDYYITHKNPRSNYYLSLGLSYPNIADADEGLKRGLLTKPEHQAIASAIKEGDKPPQNTQLGGDIFLHGGGVSRDWTLGCIALENADIKELFDKLPVKTPVKIMP